jgi:hypothetical protein
MSNIDQYRALAATSRQQADEATLPSVRERCERSALAWDRIVAQLLDTETFAAANLAAKRAA